MINYINYVSKFKSLKIEYVKSVYKDKQFKEDELIDIARGYISYIFDCDEQNDVIKSFNNITNRVKSVCLNHSAYSYGFGFLVDDYEVYMNEVDLLNEVILRDTKFLLEVANESQKNIIDELEA